jgi:hypothetical protein
MVLPVQHPDRFLRDDHPMHPGEQLEHPASGRRAGWLSLLSRARRVLLVPGVPATVFQGGLAQQAPGHAPPQRQAPWGGLPVPGGGHEQRGFKEADPPLDLGLIVVGAEPLVVRPSLGIPLRRRPEEAPWLLPLAAVRVGS